jgi:hypothetical protein
VTYESLDSGEPDEVGVDFGLPFYGGGAGAMNDFFGSTINPEDNPGEFTTVELRFDSTATQKAYRYYRDGVARLSRPPSDGTRGYLYGGQVTVNFQAWDVVKNRQLDAAYVEKRYTDDNHVPTGQIYPTNDDTWRPSTASDGDREYLFISNTTYSDTPKPEYEIDDVIAGTGAVDPSIPFLYAFTTSALDDENPYPDNGEKVVFTFAVPARRTT